ncbi:MFS transporter protein [Rutstroemia sp. NJR-2017a WRK4]|nr:MFS transporter protein [Rutstroemia sp. NJR-2017a WRK4]
MAFQPAHGQIFSLFSVKIAFLGSILLFEIGSIISAAAPGSIVFIFGRLVCGAAAGGIWCGVLTLVAHVCPPRKRYLYVSVVTSMYGVASAAGPLLGGVFTDSRVTWRFCFWINLLLGNVCRLLIQGFTAIGFLSFVMIVLFLQPPELSELGKPLTVKKNSSELTGLAPFFLSLPSPASSWRLNGEVRPTPGRILEFGAVYWDSFSKSLPSYISKSASKIAQNIQNPTNSSPSAMIPTQALRNFEALLCLLFQLFISMVIGIQIYYLPIYFQSVRGHSAASSGVLTLPYIMTLLLSPMASGAYITASGHYIPVMWIGASLAVAGSVLLTTLDANSSTAQYGGYQVLAALGAGVVQQIPFTAVPLALPSADVATASALVSFCNNLGPVVVLTLGNILFTNVLGRKLEEIAGLNGSITGSKISGLVDLGSLVPPQFLGDVRHALAVALNRTLVLAIPAAALCVCIGIGIQLLSWKKTKSGE